MNKLQKILTELTPEYSYRVKFACEPSSEELHKVVTRLTDRYDAFEVGPMKKTIFQERPIDFYNLDCGEIWMFDFKCKRGVQPQLLLFEIGNLLSWSEALIHVRDNLDPYQEAISDCEDDIQFDEYEPRLLDPEYSEVPKVNAEELGGQGRADKAVKDAMVGAKKTSYAEYMSAGFGKKG